MRHLYLHCGLPKTGTTSIQMSFANSRDELRSHGYDYPDIGVNADRTAHHNFARELQHDPEFAPARGTIDDLVKYIRECPNNMTIILSSEGFTNCICNSKTNHNFLQFIRILEDVVDKVELVFTFRKFSQFFESNYLYKIKTGTGGKNGAKPADGAKATRWLKNLFGSLALLEEFMGDGALKVCDVDEQGGALGAFASLIEIPLQYLKKDQPRRNKRLGLKKAAFLYQLQYSAGGTRLGRLSSADILKIGRHIQTAPDLENEVFDYHVISFDEVNAIQQAARELMPSFLAKELLTTSSPEIIQYQSVILSDIVLTPDDVVALHSAIPHDFLDKIA